MANQLVLTDAFVSLTGPGDISLKTKSVTINFAPDMVEDTHMGHTGKSRMKGLPDWSIDLEVYQDFTDNELDEDIWTLVNVGTPFTFEIRPSKTDIVGTSNPKYTGTGIIDGYAPISGGVGELQIVKIKIIACGTTLIRATA